MANLHFQYLLSSGNTAEWYAIGPEERGLEYTKGDNPAEKKHCNLLNCKVKHWEIFPVVVLTWNKIVNVILGW